MADEFTKSNRRINMLEHTWDRQERKYPGRDGDKGVINEQSRINMAYNCKYGSKRVDYTVH